MCAQRVILGLLLTSAAAAVYASSADHPYSDAFPKRIMLQHLHLLAPDGSVQASPTCSPCVLFCIQSDLNCNLNLSSCRLFTPPADAWVEAIRSMCFLSGQQIQKPIVSQSTTECVAHV